MTYRYIFLAGMIAAFVIRMVAVRRASTSHTRARASVRHWTETLLHLLAPIAQTALPVLALTSVLKFADTIPDSASAGKCGAAALVASLWLLWRSHADLGLSWSHKLEVKDGQALVCDGIYERIRHPMYAAMALYGIAQVLMINNWIAGPATLAVFAYVYFFRVPREEDMMFRAFPAEYPHYYSLTGKFRPRSGQTWSQQKAIISRATAE